MWQSLTQLTTSSSWPWIRFNYTRFINRLIIKKSSRIVDLGTKTVFLGDWFRCKKKAEFFFSHHKFAILQTLINWTTHWWKTTSDRTLYPNYNFTAPVTSICRLTEQLKTFFWDNKYTGYDSTKEPFCAFLKCGHFCLNNLFTSSVYGKSLVNDLRFVVSTGNVKNV